jgi:hypothetical protein
MMGKVTYHRPGRWARSARSAALVAAWLVAAACGRIGFDPPSTGDATGDTAPPADAPGDAPIDASFCEYLPTCMTGQITCCTATDSFCTLDGPGVCAGGRKAQCSVPNNQGCPPGWPCCITPQRPEPSCYNPMLPVPC